MPNTTLNGYGPYDGIRQMIDPTQKSARVSIRPPEVLGSYSLSMTSGLVAAAMAGPLPIWEMRWPIPTTQAVALVRSVRFSCAAATLFTAGIASFDMFLATGFTVLDATGGATAITLAGESQALSPRYSASQLQSTTQSFVVLGTANTGLTGGTKTLDNNAICGLSAGVPVTAGTGNTYIVQTGTVMFQSGESRPPIELQQNEGLVLRCLAIPATGTWTFTVEVQWDEVVPATYFF